MCYIEIDTVWVCIEGRVAFVQGIYTRIVVRVCVDEDGKNEDLRV